MKKIKAINELLKFVIEGLAGAILLIVLLNIIL